MKRRSFLKNAACVGVCAGLLGRAGSVLAGEVDGARLHARLQVEELQPVASAGLLRIEVDPASLVHADRALAVRAWFAGQDGPVAFTFASYRAGQLSSRLRFHADAGSLLGFDVVNDDTTLACAPSALCALPHATGLQAGRYRLTIERESAGNRVALGELQLMVAPIA